MNRIKLQGNHAVYMRHLNHVDIGHNAPLNDRRDKDVTVLNHCFEDISCFVTRLQHVSYANDELERRTKYVKCVIDKEQKLEIRVEFDLLLNTTKDIDGWGDV